MEPSPVPCFVTSSGTGLLKPQYDFLDFARTCCSEVSFPVHVIGRGEGSHVRGNRIRPLLEDPS